MYKKIIAVFLAVCMGMLAGCSQKPAQTETTSQAIQETETAQQQPEQPEQLDIVLTTDTKNLPYDMTEFSININVENAVLKDSLSDEMVFLDGAAADMKVTQLERLSDTSLNLKAQGNVAEYVRQNYRGSVTIELIDAFAAKAQNDSTAAGNGNAGTAEMQNLYASLSVPIVFPRVGIKAETLTVSDGTAQFEIDLENAVFEQGLSADNFELSYTGDGEAAAVLKEVMCKDDNVIQVKIAVNTDDIDEVKTLLKDYKLYIMPEAFSASDRLAVLLSCPAPDVQASVSFWSTDEKGTDMEITLSVLNGSFENVTNDMISFEDNLAGAQDIKAESTEDAVTVSLHVPEVLDEDSFYGVIALSGGVKDLYGDTDGATALVIAQDDNGDRLFAELAEMTAKQIAVAAGEATVKKLGSRAADMAIDKVLGAMGINTTENIYKDTQAIKATCNEINGKCDEIKEELATINGAMKQYFSTINTQIENLTAYAQNRDLNNKITSFDEELGKDTLIALCRYNDLFTQAITAYSEMVESYDIEKQDYDAGKKAAYEKAYNRLIDQLSAATIRGRDIVHATFAIGRAVMGSRTNRSFIFDYDEIVMPQYNFEEASINERNNYRNSIKTLYERAVTWSIYLMSATGEKATIAELLSQEEEVKAWFAENEVQRNNSYSINCLTLGVHVNRIPVYSNIYGGSTSENIMCIEEYADLGDGSTIFGTRAQWEELIAHEAQFNITLYEEMKLAGFEFKDYRLKIRDFERSKYEDEDNPSSMIVFTGYYITPKIRGGLIDILECEEQVLRTVYSSRPGKGSDYWEITIKALAIPQIHFYSENGHDKSEIENGPWTIRIESVPMPGKEQSRKEVEEWGGYGVFYTIAQ